MEKYTMFMYWKNQYSENEYTTQGNLQIQHNPYQAAAPAAAKLRQSCPTLCNPIDDSPQAARSLGFSRQEHWSWLTFPSSTRVFFTELEQIISQFVWKHEKP